METALYLHAIVEIDCVLSGEEFYQNCISGIFDNHTPEWSKVMSQGRIRFLDSLDQNERDVFYAAGLAQEPPTRELVEWWDEISGIARMVSDQNYMEQARIAEMLTIEHETKRLQGLGINQPPIWKGLDDNFAGYDVLSYDMGEFGTINKMIEVKSTTSSPLKFTLSRNEWTQALKFDAAYIFHIWDMAKSPPILHVRTVSQVLPHIPTDNEKGAWKNAIIPVGGA